VCKFGRLKSDLQTNPRLMHFIQAFALGCSTGYAACRVQDMGKEIPAAENRWKKGLGPDAHSVPDLRRSRPDITVSFTNYKFVHRFHFWATVIRL
jgi:hypothetical protein